MALLILAVLTNLILEVFKHYALLASKSLVLFGFNFLGKPRFALFAYASPVANTHASSGECLNAFTVSMTEGFASSL